MLSKISQYVMYVLMITAVIVTVMAFSDNYDPIIYTMYAFFGLSVFLALILALVGMVANPRGIKFAILGILGFAILFGISYAFSGDEVLKAYAEGTTASDSKLIGMGIIAMYILFFGSIAAVIYSAVSKMLK